MRVVDGVVGRVAPEAFLAVLQMRYNAVSFAFILTARRGSEEPGLAADQEVAGGRVAGAELAGAVEQAGVGAQAVALPVVDGVGGGDKRRHDKQSAQNHAAVRTGSPRASHCTAPSRSASPRHSRAVAPRPHPGPAALHIQIPTRNVF